MLFVKGYVVIEKAGFDTKQYFEGAVNAVHYVKDGFVRIQGIDIPEDQIRTIEKCSDSKEESVDLPALLGYVQRKRKYTKKAKDIVDYNSVFSAKYNEALNDLKIEFGCMQRLQKMPEYEIVDEFVKSCDWQQAMLAQSIKTKRATKLTIADSLNSIDRYFNFAMKKIQAAPSVKDLLACWNAL